MIAPPPPRTIRDVVDEIQTHAGEHGSVATMLRSLFIKCADSSADGDRQWMDQLWEGLAVVAQYVQRDSMDVSNLADELHRRLDEHDRREQLLAAAVTAAGIAGDARKRRCAR